VAHWLDRLFYLALPRQPFFAGGWGDRSVLDEPGLAELVARPPDRIRVAWEGERRGGGMRTRDGVFESPEARLPGAVRQGRVRLLLPERREAGAICLVLAASGDQGFALRTRFAAPLLVRGIGALLLENAYYGRRRPPGQPGAALRTVSDLFLMAAATVGEGRALLEGLRQEGHGRLGVAGYSMGGQMTALVAASLTFALAAVPMAPCNTPATVFTEGLISRHPRWEALARAGGTAEEARAVLHRLLSRHAATDLPPPADPRAAVVVANRRDGVVAPGDMRRIAEHWGCELRWLDTGHVGAVVRYADSLRQAVVDAFERLPGPCGASRAEPGSG
jgi:dienelactone hydrolase